MDCENICTVYDSVSDRGLLVFLLSSNDEAPRAVSKSQNVKSYNKNTLFIPRGRASLLDDNVEEVAAGQVPKRRMKPAVCSDMIYANALAWSSHTFSPSPISKSYFEPPPRLR